MKFILSSLFILCHFYCAAQTNRNYTPKHFAVKPDGTELKEILNNPDGLSRWYYIEPEMWINDVTDDGQSYMKGRVPALVCVEANYKNNKKNGLVKIFLLDSSDHSRRYLLEEQTFLNDKLNGTSKTYSLNGLIYEIKNFKADSLHGIYRQYAPDGKSFEEELEYFNGSSRYNIRKFFKSGKLEMISPIKNDQLNGIGFTYFENGKLSEKVPFVNDKEHGIALHYYQSGVLKEEMPYKNGIFHGIRKFYHPNGKIMSIEEYKEGKFWNALGSYTNKGVKRNAGTLKNGNGTLIYYDDHGAVSSTMHFVNGVEQ